MKTTSEIRSSPMRHAVMVLVAVSCLSVFASAQTAEELVSKNIQAKGGLDRIKAAKTRRMTGKLKNARGRVAIFGQTNMRPDLVRQNLTMQGMTAVQAYDGSVGWQTQPFRGRKDPELMGEDNLRDLLLAADFDGPLVDYAEKGNTIKSLGPAEVEGDAPLGPKAPQKTRDIFFY